MEFQAVFKAKTKAKFLAIESGRQDHRTHEPHLKVPGEEERSQGFHVGGRAHRPLLPAARREGRHGSLQGLQIRLPSLRIFLHFWGKEVPPPGKYCKMH